MIRTLEFDLDKYTATVGLLLGLLVVGMGGWSAGVQVMVWFLLLDFVLGTLRAAVQGKLSSWVSLKKTGLKLVLLWALTTFAYQLDCRMGTGTVARDGVVVFFTVAQGTSILENAVPIGEAVGWTVPPFLKKLLAQLGDNKNSKGD